MKKIILIFTYLVLCCALFAVTASGAFADSYPNKPLRLIVPFSPGGPTDILARLVAEKLTERWGQQVVVENKPGADGAIAMEFVAKAAPDGYTLILGTSGSVIVTPSLNTKLRYDPVKDFEPITQLTTMEHALLVNPALPVQSVKELIALAKAKPGQLNYGSGSSVLQIFTEMFKVEAGVDIAYIPYKGMAPAMTALISGEVGMLFAAPLTTLSYIKAGKARAIAICSAERLPALPDVPTMSEAGFPGFEASTLSGVLAPAKTPKEIVQKLNTEIVSILRDPAIQDRLSRMGSKIVGSTPREFAALIEAELKKYAKVIKASGIPRIE